ncbi:transmembrane protein, putative (macronuclear) [Tetrahymena thermophila SB210]|uniref:Transmembrane protein, putative n=1 Tax=Tetrahymena thermophila (strain SB210) TaxID=312017 RepID=I7LWP8_TETTS|nr:transmembrane protein, putative [Tetrahymena thermophila SB210]EAS02617.3 transmembrane protein, putative [Tetrahymena thermophila SB210]|eukprot:XP_001022862.3 transmembrane protein, putative [Tetrahymena thermophila SB210]
MQISQNEKGNMILQNQQPNIYKITIVGWYRLIGKSNQNYLLIQIKNSATQNVIRIVYNPVKMQIMCSILDVDLIPQDITLQIKPYLQDKWFFIRIGVNLQDKISNKSYIYYTIMYDQKSYISQSLIYTSQFNIFDNNNFEFFFGSKSYYPYSRSCAMSKQILAFLGQSNDSNQGPFLEISMFETFLLPMLYLHFDFFMASSNSLYNLSENFKMCQQFLMDYQSSIDAILAISPQYFDYETQTNVWTEWYYLALSKDNPLIYDNIIDENYNSIKVFTYQYKLDQWYKITINQKKTDNSSRQIQIGSLKLYLGGFIQQCDDCILKINDQECLYCANSSDYLEEGKYYSCKSSCKYPFQVLPQTKTCSFVHDKGLCDEGKNTGTDRFFLDECTCPKGQYYEINQKKCLNCLKYCTSCKNAQSCYPIDNIGYSGYCDKNSFNNGIKCLLELQFIDSSQSVLLKAHIEAQTDIWIGFYYDYLGIYLLVKQLNQQNSFYSSDVKNIIKYNLDDPHLVFGIQSPLFQDKFPLCGRIGRNNWIIKGDLSMRPFINTLFTFSDEDLTIIADFKFLEYKESFQNNQSYIANKIELLITFTVQPYSQTGDFAFDQIKGFQIKSNQGIINLNKNLNSTPFVIKLSFTANYFEPCSQQYYSLLQLVSQKTLVFTLGLKANYLDYQYDLEICSSDGNCKKSALVKFNYLDPNIIILKVEYLKYSDKLTSIKFNILLNYVEDEFELEIPQNIFIIPPKFYDIVIGGTSLQQKDPIIYYSRLEVYTGGFYYVSYDNQDYCFVFINRQNMTCILPKQGYALNRDGIVVSITDCNQNIQQNEYLYYYNKYTMTCENSGAILPNCRNINIDNFTCIQCIDDQMILSKNCSCPDGMYLDLLSQTCQKCSEVCKTCSGDQNNCLECKKQNQNPPLCSCIQHNFYLDANLNCQTNNAIRALKISLIVQLAAKEELTHHYAIVILLLIKILLLIRLQTRVFLKIAHISAWLVILITNVFNVGEIGFSLLIVYADNITMMTPQHKMNFVKNVMMVIISMNSNKNVLVLRNKLIEEYYESK